MGREETKSLNTAGNEGGTGLQITQSGGIHNPSFSFYHTLQKAPSIYVLLASSYTHCYHFYRIGGSKASTFSVLFKYMMRRLLLLDIDKQQGSSLVFYLNQTPLTKRMKYFVFIINLQAAQKSEFERRKPMECPYHSTSSLPRRSIQPKVKGQG